MGRVSENKEFLRSLDQKVTGDYEECHLRFLAIQTSVLMDISKSLAKIADEVERLE